MEKKRTALDQKSKVSLTEFLTMFRLLQIFHSGLKQKTLFLTAVVSHQVQAG